MHIITSVNIAAKKMDSSDSNFTQKSPFASTILVDKLEYNRKEIKIAYDLYNCKYFKNNLCKARLRNYKDNLPNYNIIIGYEHSSTCPYILDTKPAPDPEDFDKLIQANRIEEESKFRVQIKNEIELLLEKNPFATINQIKDHLKELGIENQKIKSLHLKSLIEICKRDLGLLNYDDIIESYSKTKMQSEFYRGTSTLIMKLKQNTVSSRLTYSLWASQWQLLQLRAAENWFIDCTFGVVPRGYTQLMVVMCKHATLGTAIPCVFALLNSKSTEIYEGVFSKIRQLLKVRSDEVLPISITSDFEKGLRSAISDRFPGTRIIGCLFHFAQCLKRKASKFGIYTKENKEDTKVLIAKLKGMCWKKDSYPEIYITIQNRIKDLKRPGYEKFIKYFDKTWIPKLEDGTIDYSDINSQKYRSNSLVEGYYGNFKKGLTKKPIFLKFIIHIIEEENNVRVSSLEKEDNWPAILFSDRVKADKKLISPRDNLQEISTNPIGNVPNLKRKIVNYPDENRKRMMTRKQSRFQNKKIQWLTWHNNSCRFDAFLTVFTLGIYNKAEILWDKAANDDSEIRFLVNISQKINQRDTSAVDEFSRKEISDGLYDDIDHINKPGAIGSIASLFRYFNRLEFCFISISEEKRCWSCQNYSKQTLILRALIGLNDENTINLKAGLEHLLVPNIRSCLGCGKCDAISERLASLPKYLFIVLDNPALSNNDSYVDEEIEIQSCKYNLCSYVSNAHNHFYCLVKDPTIYILGEGKEFLGWFIHDGLKSHGCLVGFDKNLNFKTLSKEHIPYIIIYAKN